MFFSLWDVIKTYFQPLPHSGIYFVYKNLNLNHFDEKFIETNPEYKHNDFEYYIIKINGNEVGIVYNMGTDLPEILYTIVKESVKEMDDIEYKEGLINIINIQSNINTFMTGYDRIRTTISFEKILKLN